MRAKPGRDNYSTRKYAPPQITNPDENRQQWDKSNAEARALAARERAMANEKHQVRLKCIRN